MAVERRFMVVETVIPMFHTETTEIIWNKDCNELDAIYTMMQRLRAGDDEPYLTQVKVEIIVINEENEEK